MECNKDEAIRAREIAERKMQNNDFASAKRFAIKAQQLYANLDSISMIIAVCDVHCAAQNKMIGPGVNWYDVLQIEKMADEAAIKKQYRKLALLLHPDKNKFAGAEAAFKLIGEANRVLSNNNTRSAFDLKVKASMKTSSSTKPPFYPSSGSSFVKKQHNTQDNINGSVNQQSSVDPPQQKSHIFRQGSEKFWTRCPCCRTSFEYYKLVLRRHLCCQSCKTSFIAYETEAPVSRSSTYSSGPESLSGKRYHDSVHKGPEAAVRTNEINDGSNGHSVRKNMAQPPTEAGLSAGNLKRKGNDAKGVNFESKKNGPKTEVSKPVTAKPSRSSDRKRGRPEVVDCSQSSDGVGDADMGTKVNQNSNCTKPKGSYDAKKLCRNKSKVSCAEGVYDDSNFAESTKIPENVYSDNKNKEAHISKGSVNDRSDGIPTTMTGVEKVATGTSHNENVTNKKGKWKGQNASDSEEDEVDLSEEEDVESDTAQDISPISYDCPDSEFYDFDKDKEKSCFDVDQLWAAYDTVDAMPRFYARVRKVYSSEFKLRITWLEPDTQGGFNIKWTDEGLPTACGMFKYGTTEDTTDYLMFSHQMRFETGKTRFSFVIYPRAGETWALFRNWDIDWADDPEKHKPYKFEFVVVLSDFDQKEGIEVAYLKKLGGFVSLFQPVTHDGMPSFKIPPGNLLQFSHRVPSFRISSTERDDVPLGSYELDAASLPDDIDELVDFTERKLQNEKKDTPDNVSRKQSQVSCEKLRTASGLVEKNSSNKTSSPDDAYQGCTNVKNSNDFPNEVQSSHEPGKAASVQDSDCIVFTPCKPTTVVRRSPRGFAVKKNNNTNVSS